MLLVAAINLWGSGQIERAAATVSAARDSSELEARLRNWMLQSRRHEKDFLVRYDQATLAQHAGSAAGAARTVDELASRLQDDPPLLALVQQVRAGIGSYLHA
jgi:hypothetical protein